MALHCSHYACIASSSSALPRRPTCLRSARPAAIIAQSGSVVAAPATRTHLLRWCTPLAETYFGPPGSSASAQSSHTAQNLGTCGRTLHAANGLLMADSLQAGRLRLSPRTQQTMDHSAGNLGVDVIDELGAAPANLLHADAVRETYGRAARYGLVPTRYTQAQATWGRMAANILSGDFCQLPPSLPPRASCRGPGTSPTSISRATSFFRTWSTSSTSPR